MMVKHLYYLTICEILDQIEDREKFNLYCQKSSIISTEIREEAWVSLMKETEDFRHSFQKEMIA